jgi:recombinational DNA repair ATPase RecF
MTEVAGESPILLFDDVMSELDPSRRAFVEALAVTADQAIITGTEAAVFSTKFRVASTGYRLYDGHLATA